MNFIPLARFVEPTKPLLTPASGCLPSALQFDSRFNCVITQGVAVNPNLGFKSVFTGGERSTVEGVIVF